MKNFISKIQEKPYETRVRILWSTVGVAAIILVAVFVLSVKSTLKNVDGKKLIDINQSATSTNDVTTTPYAAVERVERTEKVLKIYFNYHNTTDDILNISKIADITLTFEDNSIKPQAMTDRQGKTFIQKVLSKTQNFGILTFSPINTGKAVLTFDQMFFEKDPSKIFQQKLELNLDELSKPENLRN